MNTILKIIKDWILPIAMLLGIIGYFLFAKVDILHPLKPFVFSFVRVVMPLLIFIQLLFAFCKIDPKDLKIRVWHIWLLLFQLVVGLLFAIVLIFLPVSCFYKEVLEGAMVCFVCPTATAAVIITAKLGGDTAGVATYTLLSNFLVVIVVPLLFPLIEPHYGASFFSISIRILMKVLPLLVLPFVLAMCFKYFIPRFHAILSRFSGLAFYLWSFALTIVCGQTIHSIRNSDVSAHMLSCIAIVVLLVCVIQFFVGKRVGGLYNYRISAGQALGQKNTVLAIWMSYTYLNPLSSVAPSAYVLWQNMINSWQLWHKIDRS